MAEDDRLASRLSQIPNIDGAFIDDSTNCVYLVAREHQDVDWGMVLEAEDDLAVSHGIHLDVTVRAHQGRPWESSFPYCRRLW